MFQSLNLEVEKAKAIEKARQEKAIKEHTSKVAEQAHTPISSYGLFQRLKKSEMKTGLVKDVINPDEAMKEFEKSAKLENSYSEYFIGNMYENALGVRKNIKKNRRCLLNR